MATSDLKSILHQQIDRLQDPEDIQDLFLTVSEFVSQRIHSVEESPELLAHLEQSMRSAKDGQLTTHDTVVKEAKQWITR